MNVKERLRRVIDELSDEEAETMLRRIETLRAAQFVRYLDAAHLDEEHVTAEEAAIAEVEADRAAGVPRIPFDDIKRDYE